jgi:transcriptional regulator with XRE-family HTH domain
MGFQKRVKELREEKGWTQSVLAKKLNIARSNISKYESGALDASTEMLVKLADIFGCTTNYLLDVDENTPEANKMIEDLKQYQKAAIMAKESGISPEALEEQIQLLRKIFGNKN